MVVKFTRKEYLSGACTHHEYYAQFVTPRIRNIVASRVDLDKFIQDEQSHTVSGKHYAITFWDNLMPTGFPADIAEAMRRAGDYPTKAGAVCLLKCAATMLFNERSKAAE